MDIEQHPVCSHLFGEPGKLHYCNYIKVPALLDAFYRGAQTVDEILLCSGLYSYCLWWRLQGAELEALQRLFERREPLTAEQCHDAIKRANRCVEIGRIQLQQGVILRSELLRHKADIKFRFSSANTSQSEQFHKVAWLTRQIEQSVGGLRLREESAVDEPSRERLLSALKDLVLNHCDNFGTVQRDFTDLLWAMHEQPAPRVARFEEVVPEEKLLSLSYQTMAAQHPQTADPQHGNDELTFIIAHQSFEVWFPAVIRSIQEAARLLNERPARVWEAEGLARRVADIFGLFGRMIHMPQTMTAADYIVFRSQLQAGSGVESYQFRSIEIAAGQRDRQYRRIVERMQLLTPDLKLLWDAPSLNSALLGMLASRGIIAESDSPEEAGRKLAKVLMPSGASNPNVDVMALAESLVRFEQNVELWRHEHIAMVTRMIGRKPGTGAISYGKLPHEQEEHFDSLPYLYNTLKYGKIFPVLWDARDYLQEH